MIRFISFKFQGDKFYEADTVMPLGTPGLTLLRGVNFDAQCGDDLLTQPSNGTGKTRLMQILEGFIYGKTARGPFKKMVSGSFSGSLEFEDLRTKTHWLFTLDSGSWTVHRNGELLESISHKNSDMQTFLQQTIGITRDEWSYFVQIDGDSLRTLIKGKPAERRAYLEEFFNIDAFYDEKLNEYKQKVKQLSVDLQLLEAERVRLSETEAALETMPGVLWLKRQVEFLSEISSTLSKTREQESRKAEGLRLKLKDWEAYRRLLAQYENFDYRAEETSLKADKKEKDRLCEVENKRLELKRFVDLQYEPHLSRKPKDLLSEPEASEPDAEDVAAKKVQLAEIKEKIKLRDQIREKQSGLPDLDFDEAISEAESARDLLIESKAKLEHKLSVLEKTHGQNECPTCGQDLPDAIKKEDPASVRGKIKALRVEQDALEKKLRGLKECLKLKNEIKLLQDRFDKYPRFGVRPGDAEAEVKKLEMAQRAWKSYRESKQRHEIWLKKFIDLEAKATALGYPELLANSCTLEIAHLEKSIKEREKRLTEAQELKRLMDIVFDLPPYTQLQDALRCTEVSILDLDQRIAAAAELRGVYGQQAKQRQSLLDARNELNERLVPYEGLRRRMKLYEFLVAFYSPTGFKLYDLKQRCARLVERANHWSKVFFQEPYEWSLSEDIDDLNLFVKAVNLKEEPYPVALLSAGERNRAARVLLFAQLEMIPPSKKVNFLFLDEIETNLDEIGIRAFTEVAIPKLKETFPDRSIVLVSHLKDLKTSEHLDHQWLAERRTRKTKLTLQPWSKRRQYPLTPSL